MKMSQAALANYTELRALRWQTLIFTEARCIMNTFTPQWRGHVRLTCLIICIDSQLIVIPLINSKPLCRAIVGLGRCVQSIVSNIPLRQ